MNSNESLRRVKDKKSETLNSVLLLEEVKTRVRRPVPIKCERGARKTFSSRGALRVIRMSSVYRVAGIL